MYHPGLVLRRGNHWRQVLLLAAALTAVLGGMILWLARPLGVLERGEIRNAPQAGSSIPAGQRIDTASTAISLVSQQKWDVGNPWFSPDGASFFALINGSGLVVGSSDGSGARVLDPNAIGAAWVPDSTALTVAVGDRSATSGQIALYTEALDGSSKSRLTAQTDAPGLMQVVSAAGEVAYLSGTSLHMMSVGTRADTVAQGVTIDRDPTNDEPYSIAPDGKFVALMQGTTVSVTDLATGVSRRLTSAIDGRRWAPYSWSSDGLKLAYADVSSNGFPEIVVYDRQTQSSTVVMTANQHGIYAGISWSPTGGWLVFAFHPAGNAPEDGASYQAINVSSGVHSILFTSGVGLRLSPDGHRITFTRTVDPSRRGSWVASLSY